MLGVFAVVVAMSGVAVALPGSNTVTSGDIQNGQVKNKDLGSNSVTSGKVRHNTLTGSDIRESSLGKVPSAGSADKVGGVTLRRFVYAKATGDPGTLLLSAHGVQVTATCNTGRTDVVVARTGTPKAYVRSHSIGTPNLLHNQLISDGLNAPSSLFPDNDSTFELGVTTITTATGHVIDITWQSDNANSTSGTSCAFSGTATVS